MMNKNRKNSISNNYGVRKMSVVKSVSPQRSKKSDIIEQIEELSRKMDDMRKQQYMPPPELISPKSDMGGYIRRSPSFLSQDMDISNAEHQYNQYQQLQRMNSKNILANQEDPYKFNGMLENESKERRKAELKILELTSQLEDARRGLRETQNALIDVQHAAEILTQKRDERNAQFQKILMENKTLEAKVFELEMQLRNSEKVTKSASVSSEDRISRLQDELTVALEHSHKYQTESTRFKTDKQRLESEIENYQRKIKALETSSKHSEAALREEHSSEIDKLEDRLKNAMASADEGRKNDVKLLDAKTEYYNKVNELKNAELKLVEVESLRRQLEQKTTSLELQVHHLESQNRQKDVRINQLEQEALSTGAEMNLLKNGITKKDEEINNFIQESFDIGAKFDSLRKLNKELERKLSNINVEDFNDQIGKLKIEVERRDGQIKQLMRIEEDLNRQVKTIREDNSDLEERLKAIMLQLSLSQTSESELRQSFKVCEQALNELKSEKLSLTWKLNVEEKRAKRLEETLRRAALTKGVNMPTTTNTKQQNGMFPPANESPRPRVDSDNMMSPRGGNMITPSNQGNKVTFEDKDNSPDNSPKSRLKKVVSNKLLGAIDLGPSDRSPGEIPSSIVPQAPQAPQGDKKPKSMLGGLNFLRRVPR